MPEATNSALMNSTNPPVLERRQPGEPCVASFAQLRLWYLDQLAPGTAVYNIPFLMRVRGPLNADALRQAYSAFIGRHEILRTIFLAPSGTPIPIVLKKWMVQLPEVDLRHLPQNEREPQARLLAHQEAARPFNLARDPMLRGLLLRLTDDDFFFLQVSHHIAFEAGGLRTGFDEIAAFYQTAINGVPATLPDPPFQYSDFANWQRRFLQGDRLANLESFWKQHLSGAAQIQLPTDQPRPARWSQRGKRCAIQFPYPLLLDLQALTNQAQTTLYRSTMAAFNVFLHALTGQEDFSMGSPVLPRSVNVDGMIGFFVNTVVFRNDLAGDPTFREVLARVHASCRASLQHSDLTLEKVVDAVQPPRDPTRTPLFQVNFRAPKAPLPILQIEGLEIARPVYIDNGTSKFDLSFEIETQTGEGSYIEYCTDLFDQATIDRMRDDFEDLLTALVTRPDAKLSELTTLQAIRKRENNRPKNSI